MNDNSKTSTMKMKTLLLISLLSIFLGAISCVIGEFILPFLAGALAVVYLFDSNKYRLCSVILSIVLLIINLVGFLTVRTVTLFAPAAIILALIISLSFSKRESKSDAAYLMTIISAAFSVVKYILYAMVDQGEYTFEAVKVFFTDLHDSLRLVVIESFTEIYAASGLAIGEDIIAAVFDMQVKMMISYILIGGFVTTGIAMKTFGVIVSRFSDDKKSISEWRFKATNIFAYSYMILVLLSVFMVSADNIFAVSVLNLYNLFLVIFAYVGFNVATTQFFKNVRPLFAGLIVIVIICIFSSFALQVLAVLGVMFTIRSNNQNRIQNS